MAARQSAASYTPPPPEPGVRGDSQASDAPDIGVLMDEMLNDSKKRKEAKRQELQTDHARRVQKVGNDIKAAFAEHEKQRQEEQKQQISRLIELLKKRDAIERHMMKSVHKLEREYNEHSRAFQVAMSNKATELMD